MPAEGALTAPAIAALQAPGGSMPPLPDPASASFGGWGGITMLLLCLLVCGIGLAVGWRGFRGLRALPDHRSLHSVAELTYRTCTTYLRTQVKLLALLQLLVGAVIVVYFGALRGSSAVEVAAILASSVLGVVGSVAIAWFGMRVNTFASARTAFASLRGEPLPTHQIPLQAGMSIGIVLICSEIALLTTLLLFVPRALAPLCFLGFPIGASLGATGLRIAGGIFTKIADIGSDLMKVVLGLDEDDPRNPGVIADCTGDNAGDSVGPTADTFETYGVTVVALLTFLALAVPETSVQAELLVWIIVTGTASAVAGMLAYPVSSAISRARWQAKSRMDFEAALSSVVWISCAFSIALTFVLSRFLLGDLANGTLWWKLAATVACGTAAGALIPEVVKVFTSTRSQHVREVVEASGEGGASLNVLGGLTAGNFSAFWLGAVIIALMAVAFGISTLGLANVMTAPAVFGFGLVAFGFLGMAPVTVAVDSYGPVTDNAQSVFELSLIERSPDAAAEIRRDHGFEPDFERAKRLLEENDGAGNTFKATAKPVLIGTAAVGVTTMVFSIVLMLTDGLTEGLERLSILHAPFLLGMLAGAAVIHWFAGAAIQAVVTGAYRAVEFISRNIRLDAGRASDEDSMRVVEICTRYAQRGTINIFLGAFCLTLGFAFLDPFFLIGYLISLAISGLYQATFMANAGGAWDNAKKVVESSMAARGTSLHAATVVGDTVGDPFKDTASVAMNPFIKFTTLFGLLIVEAAFELSRAVTASLAILFLSLGAYFVARSFYGMRIRGKTDPRWSIERRTEPRLASAAAGTGEVGQ
jgi:K(+)-stimulated pyrophosphate-energized sodium pump